MNIFTAIDLSPLMWRVGDYVKVPMALEVRDDWDRIVKLHFCKDFVVVTTDNGFEDEYPYFLTLAVNRPDPCTCCGKPSVGEYDIDGRFQKLCGPCLPVMKRAVELMNTVEDTPVPVGIVCDRQYVPVDLDVLT